LALHLRQVFLDRMGAVRPAAVAAFRAGAALPIIRRSGGIGVGMTVVVVVVMVVVVTIAMLMAERFRHEPGRPRRGIVDHPAMILEEDVQGEGQVVGEEAHTDGQAHPAQ